VVVRDVAAVRGAVENAINRRVHLLIGLRAHVSIHPEMSADQFASLSQIIMDEVDGIRSVTSIRDNVINDVYPRQGNEGAIGLELLAHSQQRIAALHAIETGKPWLAGPIPLVQGGEAFIYRAPVYTRESAADEPTAEDYWGMVSLLIDKQTLVDEIMSQVPNDLQIAIRGRSGDGTRGDFFVGNESIVGKQPVAATITLPTGSWEVFGVPQVGWPTNPPDALQRRIVGASLVIVLGMLLFWVTGAAARDRESARQLRLANEEAESARQTAEHAREQLAREADAIARYAEQLEAAQIESARMMHDLQHAKSKLYESNNALKRSNEELEQFAYVASHDLQEPLRKVAAFCQLLELEYGDRLDDEGKRYLNYIVDGAHRMRNLIRDLLSFSKIQSQDKEFGRVDASKAVEGAIRSLEGRIEESGAIVNVGPMPSVRADERQLSQLMQNLIGNGLKYNESDCPTVDVSARRDGDHWLFEVADNGIGIAEENHQRVFGIFKRLHSQSSYSGTGIGLAICKRIVERFDGEISIDSKEGIGSTFRFTVPAYAPQECGELAETAV